MTKRVGCMPKGVFPRGCPSGYDQWSIFERFVSVAMSKSFKSKGIWCMAKILKCMSKGVSPRVMSKWDFPREYFREVCPSRYGQGL